jgi:hypothetical protein
MLLNLNSLGWAANGDWKRWAAQAKLTPE